MKETRPISNPLVWSVSSVLMHDIHEVLIELIFFLVLFLALLCVPFIQNTRTFYFFASTLDPKDSVLKIDSGFWTEFSDFSNTLVSY